MRLKPLGDLFIKLVRMLVAPIIFCTVVHGIASVGEAKKVGRVAIKSLIYFEVVTTIALILALLLVNLWAPGAGMHVDLKTLADSGVKAPAKPITFGQFLLNLVPASAVGAFAEGEVIPVLFFSLMFAFGLLALGPKGKPLVDSIHSVAQVLVQDDRLRDVGRSHRRVRSDRVYGRQIRPVLARCALGKLVSEFYVCCLLFVAIVLTPIAWAAGVNILRLIRYIAAELMIVVGTSSGESVFPSVIAKLRRLGVEESVVALVLPDRLLVQSRRHVPVLGHGLGVSRAGGRHSFVDRPAVGAPRDHVVYLKRRRWRRRFGDRHSRNDAFGHERDSRRQRRTHSRRSQSLVVRIRAGERVGQFACDHRDGSHGARRRFADAAIGVTKRSGRRRPSVGTLAIITRQP